MTTLTNAKAFKGILQYKSTDKFTKEAGYVYFIREFNENNEETGNAEIYFGNRKYGDVNVSQLSEIESILETKLDSNNLKTINNETLVGSGNIVVGNIVSEEDDSLSVDDVNTNTYVKYVAQSLTSAQKTQVRENIGLSNTKSKIITTSERSGTISLTANEIVHVASALTGSTTIQITHRTVNHDDEWGIKFFITSTTPPTISFTCSNSTYPISWLNNNMPIFENGYMYEMTFKQFNNQYLAVCGKFPI